MRAHKKIQAVLVIVLIFVLAAGASAVAMLGGALQNAEKAQTSVLTSTKRKNTYRNAKKTKKGTRSRGVFVQLGEKSADPFIACDYQEPEKTEYKAEVIAKETRAVAQEGGEFNVSIYIKNTGNIPWFGDSGSCPGKTPVRLGTARARDRSSVFFNPADPRWINSARIAMVESRVDPGETATFRFTGGAPFVSDIFREYFQPVAEGVAWMESKEATGYVDVRVGEYEPELEKKAKYINFSGQFSALDISGEPVVDIDISEQKLQLKFGQTMIREYDVSTGTFKTPTPLGRFSILNKQELRIGNKRPHYRMPMWQGFTQWGHGLHALPSLANDGGVFWEEALNHIGQRVSHGCIRLLNEDAEDLYNLTEIGMPIVIHA